MKYFYTIVCILLMSGYMHVGAQEYGPYLSEAATIHLLPTTNATQSPRLPPLNVRIPVLMYHHVRNPKATDDRVYRDLSCSLNMFQSHLTYFKKAGYTTITFWDIYDYIYHNKPLPPKPVMLTFDDGSWNHWQAYKILKQNKMKGVFYIVYGTIGKRNNLKLNQILAMQQDGMEIGSHTLNHYNLRTLKKSQVKKEILESKTLIEKLIGSKVISFCYPFGKYNKESLSIIKHSSYWFARTTRVGISQITGKNYELKAIRVHNKTSIQGLKNLIHYYSSHDK